MICPRCEKRIDISIFKPVAKRLPVETSPWPIQWTDITGSCHHCGGAIHTATNTATLAVPTWSETPRPGQLVLLKHRPGGHGRTGFLIWNHPIYSPDTDWLAGKASDTVFDLDSLRRWDKGGEHVIGVLHDRHDPKWMLRAFDVGKVDEIYVVKDGLLTDVRGPYAGIMLPSTLQSQFCSTPIAMWHTWPGPLLPKEDYCPLLPDADDIVRLWANNARRTVTVESE